jgi:hypothetical protein
MAALAMTMRPTPDFRLVALVLASAIVSHAACGSFRRTSALPDALSDSEFARLGAEFSEPAGVFSHSDNLVSNETQVPHLILMLGPAGGAYIGVGPEQNFSYIARLRPDVAFIVDIRSENRSLHLLYKALFELSTDRADFLSRLFSRERPAGLGPATAVADLFDAFAAVPASHVLYEANAQRVRQQLLERHRLPLSPQELAWIDYTFNAFYADGPGISYGRLRNGDYESPSYRALMTATDVWGQPRSYLSSEEAFAFVKALQARNLIVPVVGDLAGPDALRRVGEYIRQRAAQVSAFYGSNVEVYLTRDKLRAYCGNLAALPYESGSLFIDSKEIDRFPQKLKSCRPATR